MCSVKVLCIIKQFCYSGVEHQYVLTGKTKCLITHQLLHTLLYVHWHDNALITHGMNHPTNFILRFSNWSRLFCVTEGWHSYGSYLYFIMHELLYWTCISMGQAGFCRCFPYRVTVWNGTMEWDLPQSIATSSYYIELWSNFIDFKYRRVLLYRGKVWVVAILLVNSCYW